MKYLRTPDDRFTSLPDFDFNPNYVMLSNGNLRMHYLDEGDATADPILVLHGEPTWCYLYRHMIPIFAAKGHRVLAPDLIGFGRSDKPTERSDYSYQSHVDWLLDWLDQLDLKRITLVCQDWGGLLGLRLLAAQPKRFARLVVANTALPTGDRPMNKAFAAWREYSQTVEQFNAGRIVYGGTSKKISPEEVAAYNAPFPDERYQAGARQFPVLVPDSPENPASEPNREAWKTLVGLNLPVITLFGEDDMIMAGIDGVFQKLMPGARGQAHQIFPEAGHFLQEDVGPELAKAVLEFIERNP